MFSSLHAQLRTDRALQLLKEQCRHWSISEADLQSLQVVDQYASAHNGASHFYFQQQVGAVPIYNAILSVHLSPDGQLLHATERVVRGTNGRAASGQPKLTVEAAIRSAAAHLGVDRPQITALPASRNAGTASFDVPNLSRQPITSKLVYYPHPKTGELLLAWSLPIDQVGHSDYWNVLVDAANGEILRKDNYTLYCRHEHPAGQTEANAALSHHLHLEDDHQSFPLLQNGTYHVFPFDVESPIHGEQEVIVDPADPEASPLGWHDTNGIPGPEFTITRGNNVHAYADINAQNQSNDDEPDGGPDLTFDFEFSPTKSPNEQQDAAVTQLFYMNNIMHDITYHYGFDEAAGNFQRFNYTEIGSERDEVRAEAQDGESFNNANFATPPDGSRPRMQMYVWNGSSFGNFLTIDGPDEVAGSYEAGLAAFGPSLNEPVTGELAVAQDDSNNPELACADVLNGVQMIGRIAIVNRGACFFEEKVNNVARAGAIAAIICIPENETIILGNNADTPDPRIPAISVKMSDCTKIRTFIDQGITATLFNPNVDISGSFDNGIVAHEYGHGISNRLIGGPSNSTCLINDEQMGEGWSDFFTLAFTAQPEDVSTRPRGIGNYPLNEPTDGLGIRRQPYTTDADLNTYTYDDIITTLESPHALGEVWASTLWDLYWALVDEYGFDPDLYNGNGGNNRAIQLVMDGMKFLSCNPGMVDGRDGILVADAINYDGANTCLIWEVFARRGLGLNADQGSPFNRTDGLQDFTRPPECIQSLKLSKRVDQATINAGDSVTISLRVRNDLQTTTRNLLLTDTIANGMTLLPGSITGATGEVNGSVLTFIIDSLEAGDAIQIAYRLGTDPERFSQRLFLEDVETNSPNFRTQRLTGNIDARWTRIDTLAFQGNRAWFVPHSETEQDRALVMEQPGQPDAQRLALRFYHRYQTRPAFEGGVVEIEQGTEWTDAGDRIIRRPYRGQLFPGTLSGGQREAFWGDNEVYEATYVDLSDLAGSPLNVRWRFASIGIPDGNVEHEGWYVDDIELMDLVTYQSTACLSAVGRNPICASLPEGGIIVESQEAVVATEDIDAERLAFQLFPNPVRDQLTVYFQPQQSGAANLELFNASGQLVRQQSWTATTGPQQRTVEVDDLAPGIYLLRLVADGGMVNRKILVL